MDTLHSDPKSLSDEELHQKILLLNKRMVTAASVSPGSVQQLRYYLDLYQNELSERTLNKIFEKQTESESGNSIIIGEDEPVKETKKEEKTKLKKKNFINIL